MQLEHNIRRLNLRRTALPIFVNITFLVPTRDAHNCRSNAELKLQGKHFWALWTKQGQEDLDGMVERYLQRPRR
jgi:hypothetical protein